VNACAVNRLAWTAALVLSAGCAMHEPPPPEDALHRGKDVVRRMSAALAAAPALTVATRETREQRVAGGTIATIALVRQTTVHRPDRLYFTSTGDVSHEGWYDGTTLTVAAHGDKVFARAAMPETLDRALDAIAERCGLWMPMAGLLSSDPLHALIADSATGGWRGRETIDGQPTDHLAFRDRGVTWEMWVAADGAPLPKRVTIEFPETRRLRKLDVSYSDWNLAPSIEASRFGAAVPDGYETVAFVQRSAGVPGNDAETGLASPPASALIVMLAGRSYWYTGGTYYTRVMSSGGVVYRVEAAPVGILIPTLPAGCTTVHVTGVTYSRCGETYYERVGAGYRVAVIQ
jgi:hypothetical protein